MHVVAKVGGGGLRKKFSLSLSQASPPLICCCMHAYRMGAKGVQIAFKGRLTRLWFLRVLIPEKGKRALNRKQKGAKGNSVRRSFHNRALL